MELTIEEKKELSQLSGFFKKLEITANHLGVDLDDYISEYRDNGYAHLPATDANPTTVKRKDVFQKASGKKETSKTKAAKVR